MRLAPIFRSVLVGTLALAGCVGPGPAPGPSTPTAEEKKSSEHGRAGDAAFISGRYQEAVEEYALAIEQHQLRYKTEVMTAKGEFDRNMKDGWYHNLASELHAKRAHALYRLGRFDEAEAAAQTSIRSYLSIPGASDDKAPALPRSVLGHVAARKGDEKVYREQLRFLQKESYSPNAKQLAARLQEQGEPLLLAARLKSAEAAAQKLPEFRNVTELTAAADTAYGQSDNRSALACLEEAIAQCQLGRKHVDSGQLSAEYHSRVLARLHVAKARVCAELDQVEPAGAAAREAIRLCPDADPMAHYLAGWAAARKGDAPAWRAKVEYLRPRDKAMADRLQKIGEEQLKAAPPPPAPAPAPGTAPAPETEKP